MIQKNNLTDLLNDNYGLIDLLKVLSKNMKRIPISQFRSKK